MGLGPTYIPLNFDSPGSPSGYKKQRSGFSHLFIIMCLSGGMCSLNDQIIIITNTRFLKTFGNLKILNLIFIIF